MLTIRSSILCLFLQLNGKILIMFRDCYFCLKVHNSFNIVTFVINVTKLVWLKQRNPVLNPYNSLFMWCDKILCPSSTHRLVGQSVPLSCHGWPGSMHSHGAQLQHAGLLCGALDQHHGLVMAALSWYTCVWTHVYPVVFGLSLQNVFSKKLLSGDTYKFR